MPDFDTIMTEYPICPHCGTQDDMLVDVPLKERDLTEDGENDIYACPACGKSYLCTLHLQHAYSAQAEPLERKNVKPEKPRVQISDWYIQNQSGDKENWQQLVGRVFDHPTVGSYEGGKVVRTPMLLGIDFKAKIAETHNTYYILGEPDVR